MAAKLDTACTAIDGTEPSGLLSYTETQKLTGVEAVGLDDLHDAEGLDLVANVDPAGVFDVRGRFRPGARP